VATTTLTAAWQSTFNNFLPRRDLQGWLCAGSSLFLMASTLVILGTSVSRWLRKPKLT
jgi:hypothetical protein